MRGANASVITQSRFSSCHCLSMRVCLKLCRHRHLLLFASTSFGVSGCKGLSDLLMCCMTHTQSLWCSFSTVFFEDIFPALDQLQLYIYTRVLRYEHYSVAFCAHCIVSNAVVHTSKAEHHKLSTYGAQALSKMEGLEANADEVTN